MSDDRVAYPAGSRRERRRYLLRSITRSVLVSAVLFAAYALLPLSRPIDALTLVLLVGGLLLLGAIVMWDLREVARSPYPRMRALEALATVVPLFVLLFSSIYYVMARTDPGSFSSQLTRVDAFYFSVTILSTVGFGDITPVSQPARILVTVQMLSNLVIVGVVARVLVNAVQEGLRRQGRGLGLEDPDVAGRMVPAQGHGKQQARDTDPSNRPTSG